VAHLFMVSRISSVCCPMTRSSSVGVTATSMWLSSAEITLHGCELALPSRLSPSHPKRLQIFFRMFRTVFTDTAGEHQNIDAVDAGYHRSGLLGHASA
jgi:hypothetical protein